MISRDQVSDALHFIGESDRKFAELKTDVERFDLICKRRRAFAYKATDSSDKVDERKADVELDDNVQAAEDGRIAAFLAFETIKAERDTKQLIIEVWRSVESSRRQGMVV